METKKTNLLYIEGNNTISESVKILLSNSFGVLNISNETEAYNQFITMKPDIVIIELKASVTSSFKLIDNIIETNNTTPIIVIADLNDIDMLKKISQKGITHYILLFKPLQNNILINTISTIIETLNDKETIQEQNEKIEKYLEFIENKLTKDKTPTTNSQKNEDDSLFLETQAICNIGCWKQDYISKEYYWSNELFNILGINPENSKPNYELFLSSINQEDRANVNSFHKDSLKDNHIHSIDFHLNLKNNQQKLVTEKIKTYFNDKNEPIYSIGTIQDINKYEQLHNSLLQNEELMIAQSKYATMGEMISLIAHQWRQPITTISMSANNLMADIELDMLDTNVIQKSVVTITEQTQYLSKTIEDFRSFFKSTKQIEETTMGKIFDETSKIMSISLKNNDIDFRLNFDNTITIKTYSSELLQVLINIIKNAKDALSERNTKNKFIEVSITQSNEKIDIEISDNAGGIKEEHITKIFDAYFTTKDEQTGTGLGLYMSKTIIEKHLKGTLGVKNIEDGVKFHISLPKVLLEEK